MEARIAGQRFAREEAIDGFEDGGSGFGFVDGFAEGGAARDAVGEPGGELLHFCLLYTSVKAEGAPDVYT